MVQIIGLGVTKEQHERRVISNCKSIAKKEDLRINVYLMTGWYAPKALSMKEIKDAVGL
jgi:hypothetical protein